jgi:hypothetical protein
VLDLIVRDYIRSWHDTLSSDQSRIAQIRLLLEQTVMEMHRRIHAIDPNTLIADVTSVARAHVIAYNNAVAEFSVSPLDVICPLDGPKISRRQ